MSVLPSYRNQSIDLRWKSIDWFLYGFYMVSIKDFFSKCDQIRSGECFWTKQRLISTLLLCYKILYYVFKCEVPVLALILGGSF